MTAIKIAAVVFSGAALLAAGCAKSTDDSQQASGDAEIGSSLNDKSDVAVSELPEGVLQAARAVRPNITYTEAERETRNGLTYYDVGGVDADGNEIELDIMQDDDGWRVVEVQRDIDLSQTPEPVREALNANAPGVAPDRVIESDQMDGVIIYEFFTRNADGEETKYEVKFAGGEAEFLTEEWVH
jgi:uncharacterized membrane protein YkoI